ncbi:plastocyanin [Halocatena pleomorpha]|uniref:Plastocyanin n=2 Tax=Halocatena pleomorpha TaxID=1785090 RepID=A0A3P3RAR2_9EURY|nr:plastocyanin [Halocatena pleomorpha]
MGALGTVATGAGCLGTSSGDKTPTETEANEVIAGPNGNPVFDPKSIEIPVGETVTWRFESTGHNVSARPKDGSDVMIPDGATPFASFEGDNTYELIPKGETYSHTFETAGTYTYVCVPHINVGMIGNVTVSE